MRKILLTREVDDILKDAKLFEDKGFEVLALPLIKTQSLPFEVPQENFDYVVFQSQKAVKYFFEKASLHSNTKVVAVGKSTQKTLERLGYKAYIPDEESAKGLIEFFKDIKPCKVLLPRAKEGREELLNFLKERGFNVLDLNIYQTVMVEYSKEEILDVLSQDPIVVLASPSAVKSLFANLQKNMLICKITLRNVICIGETTKSAYQEHFRNTCYVPKKPSMEEVVNLALTLK